LGATLAGVWPFRSAIATSRRCWRMEAPRSATQPRSVGCRPMPPIWNSRFGVIRGRAPGRGGWTRPTSRSKASGPACVVRSTASASVIGLSLSAERNAAAAKPSFRKAPAQPRTVNPRTIAVDKSPATPRAVAGMKRAGELRRFSRLRQCKCLDIVEQDHRRIKFAPFARRALEKQSGQDRWQGDAGQDGRRRAVLRSVAGHGCRLIPHARRERWDPLALAPVSTLGLHAVA